MYEDEIPVGRAKDLKGQKFGRLTVLYRTKGKDSKRSYWKCKCECGNEVVVRTDSLMDKNLKHSCGCAIRDHAIELGKSKKVNLLGRKFGMLTVIDEAPNGKCGRVKWLCKCDCGNIVEVFADNLIKKGGHSTSCGCVHHATKIQPGNKYGKLTVLELDSQGYIKPSGRVEKKWLCQCECGNIVSVVQYNLATGNTLSCGCNKSKGELKATQILREKNIIYNIHHHFENCRFPWSGNLAEFDIYLPNLNILIEIDGIQHYQSVNHFGGEEEFQNRKKRDDYKNQWCRKNNIPLIRIPYWKVDTLCIEDLMLETTKFRVV